MTDVVDGDNVDRVRHGDQRLAVHGGEWHGPMTSRDVFGHPPNEFGIDRDVVEINEPDIELDGQSSKQIRAGEDAFVEEDITEHPSALLALDERCGDVCLGDQSEVHEDFAQSASGRRRRRRGHGLPASDTGRFG